MSLEKTTNQAKNLEVIDPKTINFFSEKAIKTLEQNLVLDDGRPRYSDEILLAFKDLLEKRIQDKKIDIKRKEKDINERLADVSNKKVYEDNDTGHAILTDQKVLASDKKAFEKLTFALNRVINKNYGICFATAKLIPLDQLLANPIAKNRTINSMRLTA